MADEPNDTGNGDSNGPPPPRPVAPAAPPPLAQAPTAPPPLAQAPPPVAAAPPPVAPAPPPPAPAPVYAPPPSRPFFTPLVGFITIVLLLAGVGAILYFGGVFDRMSGRQTEPVPVAQPVPVPITPPAPTASGGDTAYAPDPAPSGPRCYNVFMAGEVPPAATDGQTNRVMVTAAGEFTWNGAPVDDIRLRQYLDIVGQMSPMPVTVVSMEPGASPAAVATLRSAIGRALNCDFQPG